MLSKIKNKLFPTLPGTLPEIRKPKQTTWVYCPKCITDLCSDVNTTMEDTDLVRYTCGVCGHKSGWLFDCIVPILIEGKISKYTGAKTTQKKAPAKIKQDIKASKNRIASFSSETAHLLKKYKEAEAMYNNSLQSLENAHTGLRDIYFSSILKYVKKFENFNFYNKTQLVRVSTSSERDGKLIVMVKVHPNLSPRSKDPKCIGTILVDKDVVGPTDLQRVKELIKSRLRLAGAKSGKFKKIEPADIATSVVRSLPIIKGPFATLKVDLEVGGKPCKAGSIFNVVGITEYESTTYAGVCTSTRLLVIGSSEKDTAVVPCEMFHLDNRLFNL